jgi:hypothetical protein
MDRHDGGELDNVLHHDDSHASDCNGSKSIDTSSLLFKEICPPSSSSVDDPTALPMIPVYTASVPSFQCASLLKQLSLLFPKQNDDVRLSHWKRVQRIDKQHNHKDNNNEIHKEKGETTEHQQAAPVPLSMNNIHHHNGETSEKPILKRLKISSDSSSPPLLRVLIASVAHLQETLEATSTNTTTSEEEPSQSISSPTSSSSSSQSALLYQQLQQTFPCLQQLEIIHLPGRPPQSVEEYQQWNQTIWPCTFYPLRVEAAAAAANSNNSNHTHLTLEQVDYMQFGMHAALEDLHSKRHASNHDGMRGGAIIMRPPTSVLLSTTTGAAAEAANVATKDSPCSLPTIIARSTDEYHKQQQSSSSSSFHNPLSTSPIVLALQGVSRLERQAAMGDGMNHPNFQKGQYLCTGYVECSIVLHRRLLFVSLLHLAYYCLPMIHEIIVMICLQP